MRIASNWTARFSTHPGGFPERRLSEVPAVPPAIMREIQQLAQEEYLLDILQITENAGFAAARLAFAILGGSGRGQRVVVLAGGGNMGATGLAAARHMMNWGLEVEPVFAEVEEEWAFTTRRQVQILRAATLIDADGNSASEATMEQHLHNADLIIDAIAGYGFEGSPSGMAAALVQLVHDADQPVLSLDIPTGVSASTGEALGPAIKAATTLALDLPKAGMVTPEARSHVGEIYLADVGVPRVVYDRVGVRIGDLFNDGPLLRLRR